MFSIITPSFNRAHILSRAIESVINQSFQNWELIIVDDGSTDNTKEVVIAFNDKRIKYLYQSNRGVCCARNFGASVAIENYITFLDSDDYAEIDWLNNFYQEIIKDDFDFVFCDMIEKNLITNKETIVYATDPYKLGVYDLDGMYLAGAFCVKNEYFKSIGGFDENIRYGEFIELRLKSLLKVKKVTITNKIGFYYEISENGGNSNLKNKVDSNLYVMKKYKDYFETNKKFKINYLNICALSLIKLGEYKKAKKLFKETYFLQPLNLKFLLKYLISFSPLTINIFWKSK